MGKMNRPDSTTPEAQCEHFGENIIFVDSMECFICPKNAACGLHRINNLFLEKERRRKAHAQSVRGLIRLGYPRNQIEAYIDERDGRYE